MPKFNYSTENHNWDLTLSASAALLQSAINAKNDPRLSFASYVGSMILSVAAFESFLNSLASLAFQNESEWDEFEKQSVEDKTEVLFKKYSLNMTTGERPFQTIGLAVSWRNRLVHSKPYYRKDVQIDSMDEVQKLAPTKSYEYFVNEEYARRFYGDILAIIEKLISVSKIDPRAQCSYTPLS